MARRKNWSAEQIVAKLRQIEVQTAQGKSLALACKEAEISEQGGDRNMARPLQSGAAPLLAGPSASRACHPAGHCTAATHTSRHAVVSHNPVQNPGQVIGQYRTEARE